MINLVTLDAANSPSQESILKKTGIFQRSATFFSQSRPNMMFVRTDSTIYSAVQCEIRRSEISMSIASSYVSAQKSIKRIVCGYVMIKFFMPK